MEDFCFFVDREANRPEQRAAAAYMRLVKDGKLPPWAIFCFSDFKHATESPADVDQVAMIGDNFILLAPVEIDGGWEGLLVAEQVAAGKQVSAQYEGREVMVSIPPFDGYTFAKAGVEIDLVMQQPVVPAAP